MNADLSQPRLYALRFFYLVVAAGLGIVVWPRVVSHELGPLTGAATANSLLAAIGLLALILVLRYGTETRALDLRQLERAWASPPST